MCSVIYTDVNGISCMSYLTSSLLRDECICMKTWPGYSRRHYVNYDKHHFALLREMSLVCHLLPFAKVGQNTFYFNVGLITFFCVLQTVS